MTEVTVSENSVYWYGVRKYGPGETFELPNLAAIRGREFGVFTPA